VSGKRPHAGMLAGDLFLRSLQVGLFQQVSFHRSLFGYTGLFGAWEKATCRFSCGRLVW